MDGSTILLTGPPRSGTTLTCELLASVPNTVALDEPIGRKYLTGKADATPASKPGLFGASHEADGVERAPSTLRRRLPFDLEDVADRVQRFASETRTSALTRGVVRSKSVNGAVVGSKVSDEKDENGLRLRLTQVGEIPVGKPLTDDFTLAIKQCGGFTAALECPHRPLPGLRPRAQSAVASPLLAGRADAHPRGSYSRG